MARVDYHRDRTSGPFLCCSGRNGAQPIIRILNSVGFKLKHMFTFSNDRSERSKKMPRKGKQIQRIQKKGERAEIVFIGHWW